MNIWHDIAPSRVKPEDFWAVIEIEKGSKNKYELDKETGMLRLDRILYTSTHYPANYGFIPRTWAEDGDPLDVLVLCSESIRPLSLVRCFPIGVISMEDGGSQDEKIIAIPFEDPTYHLYTDISEHRTCFAVLYGTIVKTAFGRRYIDPDTATIVDYTLLASIGVPTYCGQARHGGTLYFSGPYAYRSAFESHPSPFI